MRMLLQKAQRKARRSSLVFLGDSKSKSGNLFTIWYTPYFGSGKSMSLMLLAPAAFGYHNQTAKERF
jgi:hypothetical protein